MYYNRIIFVCVFDIWPMHFIAFSIVITKRPERYVFACTSSLTQFSWTLFYGILAKYFLLRDGTLTVFHYSTNYILQLSLNWYISNVISIFTKQDMTITQDISMTSYYATYDICIILYLRILRNSEIKHSLLICSTQLN